MAEVRRLQSVGIVGAGLVGCLAALAFANKGFTVYLFELRPDPRQESQNRNLRSINLAVSARGIEAVKYVDAEMADRVLQHIIPMKGRMIHDITGTKQDSQLYGLFGETINSIDRGLLNKMLLDEISRSDIKLMFNHKLIKLSGLNGDDATPKMTFRDLNVEEAANESEETPAFREFEFDYVIGADGAHSQFRYQLQRFCRMDLSQKYIDMQYMELHIPASTSSESKFSIDANHLHIWPRHNFMLIALANEDGSFTSTFFSPWSVIESFGKDTAKFLAFFEQNFPDAYKLIGSDQLASCFEHLPRGSLMQVDVYPYNNPNGKALIIGDAAHSMVPFYGQGMNCGFEDIHVLMKLIDKNDGRISESFQQYSVERRDDLKAIQKLAIDNYYEMSSKVTSPLYLFRKKVDYVLAKYGHHLGFTWIPMYTMISFRADIKYSDAVSINNRQTRILHTIQNSGVLLLGIAAVAKAVHYWQSRH